MNMTQQLYANLLSNPKDKEDLMNVIRECSDSMARMQSEKDFIKEAVSDISEKVNIPKKYVNKLVKVYFKQNFDEEVSTHTDFEYLYEAVVNGGKNED